MKEREPPTLPITRPTLCRPHIVLPSTNQATEQALQQHEAVPAAGPSPAAGAVSTYEHALLHPSPAAPPDGVAATPGAATTPPGSGMRDSHPPLAGSPPPSSPAWWADSAPRHPPAGDGDDDAVAPTPGSQQPACSGVVPESPGSDGGGVGAAATVCTPLRTHTPPVSGTDIRLPRPVVALALSATGTHIALLVDASGGGTHVAVEAWRLPPRAVVDPPPARVATWPACLVPGAPPPSVVVVEDAAGVPTIVVGGSVAVEGVASPLRSPTALTPATPPLPLPTPFATTCVVLDADGDTLFAGGPDGSTVAVLEAPPGRGPRAAAAAPRPLPPGGDALADVASLTCAGSAADGLLAAVSRAGGVAVWCLRARRVVATAAPVAGWPAVRRVAWLTRGEEDGDGGAVIAVVVCQDGGSVRGGLLPRRAAVVRVGGAAPPAWAPLAPALAADALAAVQAGDAGVIASPYSSTLLLAARGGGKLTVWRGRDGAIAARASLGGPDEGGVALAVKPGGGGVRAACPSCKGVAVVDVGE